MKKKDKPYTLYILSITYYALVLISMLVAYENINTLYDDYYNVENLSNVKKDYLDTDMNIYDYYLQNQTGILQVC